MWQAVTQNGVWGWLSNPSIVQMCSLDAILVTGCFVRYFIYEWCGDMALFYSFIFVRPLYPECVLESRPPSSRDPGQWDLWSDRARAGQADADPAGPLWGGALGSGPAPQEATGCDGQRRSLCQVKSGQWPLSLHWRPGITLILPRFAGYFKRRITYSTEPHSFQRECWDIWLNNSMLPGLWLLLSFFGSILSQERVLRWENTPTDEIGLQVSSCWGCELRALICDKVIFPPVPLVLLGAARWFHSWLKTSLIELNFWFFKVIFHTWVSDSFSVKSQVEWVVSSNQREVLVPKKICPRIYITPVSH